MRGLGALFLLSFLTVAGALSAAEPEAPAPASTPPARSVDELITDLASETFRVRDEASRQLWALGEAVLEKLRAAANHPDPEVAFRAGTLARNIEHHITPETNPEVASLVERYFQANRDEKSEILTQIRTRRGWYQMLKLYAGETDPMIRAEFNDEAHKDAVTAAREQILADKPDEALKFLQLAPRDAESLMSLAVFHRSEGTLQAELEKAKSEPLAASAAWRAALYRASGDIPSARQAAIAADDELLASALGLFDGDPLPWFAYKKKSVGPNSGRDFYLKYVTNQWKSDPKDSLTLAPLEQMLESRNAQERTNAAALLFLLGNPRAGEPLLEKLSPVSASEYFEAAERISEAVAILGLDPDQPDYNGWVATRFEVILKEEEDGTQSLNELIRLAGLIGQLGQRSELISAYEQPMQKLAAENEDQFLMVISYLFRQEAFDKPPFSLARHLAVKWAGDDAGRWQTLIENAISDDPMAREWWSWLPVLSPDVSFAERFDGLLALMGFSADPEKRYDRWLDLAWKATEDKNIADPLAAVPEAKLNLLARIAFIVDVSSRKGGLGDVRNSLKVRDLSPPDQRGDSLSNSIFISLAVAGRWAEAAEVFQSIIARSDQSASRGELHAYAAASLRRAGKDAEAKAHDQLAERLALGDSLTSLRISRGYGYGGDTDREALWLARATIEASPRTETIHNDQGFRSGYETFLVPYAHQLLQQGKWKASAALSEAVSLWHTETDLVIADAYALQNQRLKTDIPRALSLLGTDRARAVKILENCYQMFPAGAVLADDFFPSLRTAKLIKEHDAWFDSSWKILTRLIETYPDCDRLRNGAAWVSSRAARRLDEGEKHATAALARNPDQPAFLDTMAEIHFAKGDRKTAMKWSAQAMNFAASESSNDQQIRQQYWRFAQDPLPAN